jgi:NOL1/NOP2/sun family putative RNA methylase
VFFMDAMIELPEKFRTRMEAALGQDFAALESALSSSRVNSLRVNSLKSSVAEVVAALAIGDRPADQIAWCDLGRYVSHEDMVGRHVLHALGGYYIQEASAMAVAEVLAPAAGEVVLDLAAAPGGKATHLAQLMQNQGLLICNEIHPGRARVLVENIERLGLAAVVINEEPRRLAEAWPGYFDKVLLDAPCSGEGMFRKNPEAIREWSEELVLFSARRQLEILAAAARLLKPGGSLVYSTCTFAVEENEAVIAAFLAQQPQFELQAVGGFATGLPGYADVSTHTARMWPHLLRGEGHFIAKLNKKTSADLDDTWLDDTWPDVALEANNKNLQVVSKKQLAQLEGLVTPNPNDLLHVFRGQLQAMRPFTPSLRGLKVLRSGVALADLAKERLEPHHALAHAVAADVRAPKLALLHDDPRLGAYLRGESITVTGVEDGWTLVTCFGLGLGWGKVVRGILKNHYPKALRGH